MKKSTVGLAWMAPICVLTVALAGCGVSGDLDAEPKNESKDFGFRGDHLTVETDKDVTLLPADGRTVTAERKLAGRAAKDGNASWTLKGDRLKLSGKCSGIVLNCSAKYTVYVPKGMAVTVKGSGSAGVTAKGVRGALDLTGDRGGIDIDGTAAPLKVRTDSGHIDAKGLSSSDVDVANDEGSIKLAFGKAPKKVRATSDTGSVTVQVPKDSTRYRVSATAGSSNPHIDVAKDPGSSHSITVTSKVGVIRVNTKA